MHMCTYVCLHACVHVCVDVCVCGVCIFTRVSMVSVWCVCVGVHAWVCRHRGGHGAFSSVISHHTLLRQPLSLTLEADCLPTGPVTLLSLPRPRPLRLEACRGTLSFLCGADTANAPTCRAASPACQQTQHRQMRQPHLATQSTL